VLWRLYFALLVVAYGANSVEVTPTLISVDLFVRDMSLVLAPLPDFILHNVYVRHAIICGMSPDQRSSAILRFERA
jgi:hypothetical protein